MKHFSTPLALFLLCASVSASDRVAVRVESAVDPSVGAASVKIEGWRTPDSVVSADLGLGVRSLVVDSDIGDQSVHLALDWNQASLTPSRLLWGLQGAALQHVALAEWTEFPTQGGSAFLQQIQLAGGQVPRLTMFVDATGALNASWDIEAVLRGHFDLDGVPHRVMVFDCDFDGRLAGELDRWIAGPTSLISSLNFFNPSTEMRWLDETASLGGRAIRFVGCDDDEVTIEIGEPCSVSTGLREHLGRVEADFAESYSKTRREMLAAGGEDPERPVTDTPTVWWYTTDLKSARAHAESVGKPLLLELTSQSCGYCRLQSFVTHQDAVVASVQENFACVKLLSDLDVAKSYKAVGFDGGVPHTIIFDVQGKEIGNMRGFTNPTKYVTGLRAAIKRASKE